MPPNELRWAIALADNFKIQLPSSNDEDQDRRPSNTRVSLVESLDARPQSYGEGMVTRREQSL